MGDYGIKVVNAGADINSDDIRDIIMSSQYPMFKYHSDNMGTITINNGSKDGYGTITHNLGYVPAHICYYVDPTYTDNTLIPSITFGSSFYNYYSESQCNNSNLVVGVHYKTPPGQSSTTPDQIYHDLDTGSANILVGDVDGSTYNSAIRFPSINLDKNQTIISAEIEFIHQISGTTNYDTKYRLYGIDEDNIGDVDTGKTKTTAYTEGQQSVFTSWANFSVNVKNSVEEIISRSGWSNGNNMGFIIVNNGSDTNTHLAGDNSSSATLTLILPGSISVRYRGIIFKDKII